MLQSINTTEGYAMNPQMMILNLQQQKKQTSHVLHLLLSVLTGGLWLLIWLIVGVANASHNSGLSKRISDIQATIERQASRPQPEYKG